MAKSIDNIDRRILAVLQEDASISVEALAETVHLSRNACWRRVKLLEESGVIARRVALLNPQALGLDLSVVVLVRTNEHNPQWLRKFRAAVTGMPEIIGAHRMSGDLDYVLRVRVASVHDYDRFYQDLIARVPIADISASFVMEDLKDTTALPV